MIYTAYFDESDTHGPAPNITMAGYLGTAYQWDRFGKRLAKLQRKYDFTIFHATEYKARRGEFSGWSDEKAQAFIRDRIDLVRTKTAVGITVTLPHDRFISEYRTPPIPKKMKLDSQYGACFRGCLGYLVDFAQASGDATKINIVFEGGHKNIGDCRRIFDDLKKRFRHVGSDILGTFTIETKTASMPLMVADMLAHTKSMVNAQTTAGTLPPGALKPFKGSRGGLQFIEFAPNALRDLKTGFEKMRQREADGWRAERDRRREAASAKTDG
jgi:hypothetical protein